MTPTEKLAKINEQNKARQSTYLSDPVKAARHAAANKASYLKRKAKESKKEVSFASPYGEAEKDESMEKELKEHIKQLKEDSLIPTSIKVKKSTLAKIAKIKLNKKPISLAELKDKIVEKVEKKSSQEMYINSMKRILKLFDTDDLIKVIYDKSLVEKITGDRPVNTAKADLQAILKIVDTFPISISEKLKSQIKTAFDVLKEKSFEKSAEPKEDLITFDDYIKKINDKFGKESKQYVVVSLYHELPLRDDMQLKIVDSVKATKDKEFNYLVLNKSPKGRVVIHNYKTSKGLGTIDKELTSGLTKILKKYMNSKDDKEYLFTDKKMSSYVQKMNTALGLKGGTNLMRHMAVNEFEPDSKSAEEKVALAQTMGHSVQTQKKYKQKKKVE
jgi:hypothetical protein